MFSIWGTGCSRIRRWRMWSGSSSLPDDTPSGLHPRQLLEDRLVVITDALLLVVTGLFAGVVGGSGPQAPRNSGIRAREACAVGDMGTEFR